MNTISKKFAFILFGILFISGIAVAGHRQKPGNSSPAVFTIFKLTPKQFSKGYHSERKEYKVAKNLSTRKMNRRLKGPWFKRWFRKTF